MKHICVVGLQWGDEGKGKIVDVLSESADVVIRYQGGANAGHTVYVGDEKFILHHLPTGVLREHTTAVLGNGVVVDPEAFVQEMQRLPETARGRVYLSDRAHLVLPEHKAKDHDREEEEAVKIGTTRRGIGPAYEDKSARRGIRAGDLQREGFLEGELSRRLGGASIAPFQRLREMLGDRIVNTSALLADRDRQGQRFLFEGAQGALLDLDFGTYPYVTSSNSSFLGLGAGTGFSPRRVDHVLGVTKAYATRVGEGPFPSELRGEEAGPLREAGQEYGATTGRPRRCGWIDLVALRHAVSINDIDSLAVTKADVLSGRTTVPVVVGYRRKGHGVEHFPDTVDALATVEPIIEEWPGWKAVELGEMEPFIAKLEKALEVPVSILSTGPRRGDVRYLGAWGAEVAAR